MRDQASRVPSSPKVPAPLERLSLALLLSAGTIAPVQAADMRFQVQHKLLQTSVGTMHFRPDPEHNNTQRLLGIELHNPHRGLAGVTRFYNSFDQKTWYFYVGKEYPLTHAERPFEVRAKLTGGLAHGYRGEYQHKIPFNHLGIAPVVIPSVGASLGRFESDLVIFGIAGMMLTFGARF